MKLTLQTIKDVTPLQLTPYTNRRKELAIGYNHTQGVTAATTCTQEDADKFLWHDVANLRTAISKLVRNKLNPHQERALVCLVHDIGIDEFARSRVLHYLNENKFVLASSAFSVYNSNGRVVSPTLIRRRQMEQNIFNLQANL